MPNIQDRIDFIHRRLNNEIDRWHASHSEDSLAEHLGMTEEQYAQFVKDPEEFIRKILEKKDDR